MPALASCPLPAYMTGKQVNAFTLQGASANASQVLTYDVSTIDMLALGVFKEMTFRLNPQPANIKPANYRVANYVDMDLDWEIELRDLRLADGSSALASFLANGSLLRLYCQNTYVPNVGASAVGPVFVAVGRILGGGFNQGEGEHNAALTLKPVGVMPYYGPVGSLTI